MEKDNPGNGAETEAVCECGCGCGCVRGHKPSSQQLARTNYTAGGVPEPGIVMVDGLKRLGFGDQGNVSTREKAVSSITCSFTNHIKMEEQWKPLNWEMKVEN